MGVEEAVLTTISGLWLSDAPKVNLNSRLKEDLNLDSLDLVEIILNLEELYNIGIMDEYLANATTVNDIADAVQRTLSEFQENIETLSQTRGCE